MSYWDGELITIYIAYYKNNTSDIIAYSRIKDYIEAYVEFHNCKDISVKKIKLNKSACATFENDNTTNEINIGIIKTFVNNKLINLYVPVTDNEFSLILSPFDEICELYANIINIYNNCMHFKKKYYDALNDILLIYTINNKNVHDSWESPNIENNAYQIDQLKLLYLLNSHLFDLKEK